MLTAPQITLVKSEPCGHIMCRNYARYWGGRVSVSKDSQHTYGTEPSITGNGVSGPASQCRLLAGI
jgi:hypothetical protein